jgi:small neutral amino acid transporter SnatA (MarC family)
MDLVTALVSAAFLLAVFIVIGEWIMNLEPPDLWKP